MFKNKKIKKSKTMRFLSKKNLLKKIQRLYELKYKER